MIGKNAAMNYCHKRHMALLISNEKASRVWHQTEVEIRDNGLQAAIETSKKFITRSQTDPERFDRHTYDDVTIQVTRDFLAFLGVSCS